MELRENYIYKNFNLMMTIYQDEDNPKQWMIDALNWSKGIMDTMRITKRKAQSLLDRDKSWKEIKQ